MRRWYIVSAMEIRENDAFSEPKLTCMASARSQNSTELIWTAYYTCEHCTLSENERKNGSEVLRSFSKGVPAEGEGEGVEKE